MAKVISFWSIKKNCGVSDISLCYGAEFAKKFSDKKILWMTTNEFFCPLRRFQQGNYSNSIDTLLEYIDISNKYEENISIVRQVIKPINEVNNLFVLFEPSGKNSIMNLEKLEKNLLPILKKEFDFIIVDISSFIKSKMSQFFFKYSDVVVNILLQNTALLDQYVFYKDELNNNTNAKINILNRVDNVQPTVKEVEQIIKENIFIIHNDKFFTSASNTGNLFSYYLEGGMVAKDIEKTIPNLFQMLNLTECGIIYPENQNKRSFWNKIFR